MRLRRTRPTSEEQLLRSLNGGYELCRALYADYRSKQDEGVFDPKADLPAYGTQLNGWRQETYALLLEIFPTPLEANLFTRRFSATACDYVGMNGEVGAFVYERWPTYLDRLHTILEKHLPRYTDLPIAEQLYVEDIDSFAQVRDVNPGMVAPLLRAGRLEQSEEQVQLALESILNVPIHRADWGGETNDLYTANLVVGGRRRAAAFLLKGNGLRSREMRIRDCGANGDQLVRLFHSPAEIFVVQYVGPIADAVIDDARGKTKVRRAQGIDAHFVAIDGQDTARLLLAYARVTLPKAAS